jgi:hypothetical protein
MKSFLPYMGMPNRLIPAVRIAPNAMRELSSANQIALMASAHQGLDSVSTTHRNESPCWSARSWSVAWRVCKPSKARSCIATSIPPLAPGGTLQLWVNSVAESERTVGCGNAPDRPDGRFPDSSGSSLRALKDGYREPHGSYGRRHPG